MTVLRKVSLHPLMVRARYGTAQCLELARLLRRVDSGADDGADDGARDSEGEGEGAGMVDANADGEGGAESEAAGAEGEAAGPPRSRLRVGAEAPALALSMLAACEGGAAYSAASLAAQHEAPDQAALQAWAAAAEPLASAADARLLARQAAELLSQSDFAINEAVREVPRGAGAGRLELPAGALDDSGKLAALLSVVERHRGEKVLVFSQFIEGLDLAERALRARRVRPARIDGATDVMARQAIIDRFSAAPLAECRVMLLTTRAGGVGLNLAAASVVVFLDQDWSAQATLQAEDRAHRMGQMRAVTVYRLVMRGFEAYMARVADAKAALSEELLSRAQRASGGATAAQRAERAAAIERALR